MKWNKPRPPPAPRRPRVSVGSLLAPASYQILPRSAPRCRHQGSPPAPAVHPPCTSPAPGPVLPLGGGGAGTLTPPERPAQRGGGGSSGPWSHPACSRSHKVQERPHPRGHQGDSAWASGSCPSWWPLPAGPESRSVTRDSGAWVTVPDIPSRRLLGVIRPVPWGPSSGPRRGSSRGTVLSRPALAHSLGKRASRLPTPVLTSSCGEPEAYGGALSLLGWPRCPQGAGSRRELRRGPWGPGHQGTWLSVTQWPGWGLRPPGGAAGPQRGASWTCPRLPGHSPGFPALRTILRLGLTQSGVIINPPGAGSTAQKAPGPLGPHFLLCPEGQPGTSGAAVIRGGRRYPRRRGSGGDFVARRGQAVADRRDRVHRALTYELTASAPSPLWLPIP
ncbi:collagen, type I, alpha 1a-like [Oryctolagus cuniculus]|uniref:collagen, type I, alpha 1a-like n=1 Tax=Oryctolagus cuniculus TaxID=9986 RepID=UPI0038798E7C